MIIFLCIPLGALCLVLTVLCLRARKMPHALASALAGLIFFGVAALLSYGTSVLIQEITRTN